MKTRYFVAGAWLAVAAVTAQAQDTYLNERIVVTDDLHGSARFVAMGGALGALGADLSVMGSNPAGMGLYRKSDLGLTFGAVMPHGNGWDKSDGSTYGENLARASFDQMGGVWSWQTPNDKLRYFNIGFNYQKKKNFNTGFYADCNNLGGLSQMDQLAELATAGYAADNNLTGLAVEPYLGQTESYLGLDEQGYYNAYPSATSNYTRHQKGSLQAFDFNMAFNVADRFFTGLTVGMENMDYSSWSEYAERGTDGGLNHWLYNDREISGYGVNVKLGCIVRPVEDNPFRIGLAFETPTWYRLDNSTYYNLDQSDTPESYLEYTLRTPCKARLSLGTTVGTKVAVGAEYEYANYSHMSQGYPLYYSGDPNHSPFNSEKDLAMNSHMRENLQGQHTVRLGVEYKPIAKLAVRAGYNFVGSAFRQGCTFDQFNIDSKAMDYATSTDYMRLGATNILTLGAGYRHKKFYADLTYKARFQSGDFYAFDTTGLGQAIPAVPVNLNRHQVMLGMGFKF